MWVRYYWGRYGEDVQKTWNYLVLINHILHHQHHHQNHRTSFILCMIAACSFQWLGWPSSPSRWWFVALYSGHFEGGQAAVEHDGGGLWRVTMMMMMGTVCQQQHSQCFCKNVSMDHRGHEGKLTWCIKLQASQSFRQSEFPAKWSLGVFLSSRKPVKILYLWVVGHVSKDYGWNRAIDRQDPCGILKGLDANLRRRPANSWMACVIQQRTFFRIPTGLPCVER